MSNRDVLLRSLIALLLLAGGRALAQPATHQNPAQPEHNAPLQQPSVEITGHSWGVRWLVSNPCPIPDSKNQERQYETLLRVYNSSSTVARVKEIRLIILNGESGVFLLDSSHPATTVRVGEEVHPIASVVTPPDTPMQFQKVLFRPHREGDFLAQVIVVSEAGDTAKNFISGSGIESHVAVAGFDADTSVFVSGLSVSGTIDVTSTGKRRLLVYNVVPEDPTSFTITSPTSFPVYINPGEKLTLTVNFHPTAPGAFSTRVLVLGDQSYCDGTDSTAVLTGYASELSSAPLLEAAVDQLELHPTPAHDRVELSLVVERGTKATITLFDSRGRAVRREEHAVERGRVLVSLDVEALESGMYYCRVEAEGATQTAPLVIAR